MGEASSKGTRARAGATARGSRAGFDPIAAVEAAYRLDGGRERWLQRLAETARPGLDQGLGVQAMTYDLEAPVPVPSAVGLAGSPPGVERYVREINYQAPPDELAAILSSPTRLYSYSELAARFGGAHEDFFLEHPAPGLPPFRDWIALVVTEPGGAMLVGGLSERRVRPSRATRRRWQRIATHLSAALRLILRLEDAQREPPPEAVLAPDGRCLHAEDRARSRDARERLREAARRIDRARGRLRRRDPQEALELWRGLVDGRWSLVDRFDSDGRRFVVALRNESPHRDPRALTVRQSQVAHLVSLGLSNKEIGYALGLSESAVGTHVGAALRKLNLRRREELAAEMATREVRTSTGRVAGVELTVASRALAALPDDANLSPAEREVVRAALAGKTDAAIARARGRSPRTVANQLRSAFHKLGVSSRGELAARLNAGTDR
jgi:DNA-binding CsgD family transcriptional regulator